jgi:hypothetical protein
VVWRKTRAISETVIKSRGDHNRGMFAKGVDLARPRRTRAEVVLLLSLLRGADDGAIGRGAHGL